MGERAGLSLPGELTMEEWPGASSGGASSCEVNSIEDTGRDYNFTN